METLQGSFLFTFAKAFILKNLQLFLIPITKKQLKSLIQVNVSYYLLKNKKIIQKDVYNKKYHE
jgi:hypothetical protein